MVLVLSSGQQFLLENGRMVLKEVLKNVLVDNGPEWVSDANLVPSIP